jgi:hypothetical protein
VLTSGFDGAEARQGEVAWVEGMERREVPNEVLRGGNLLI